MIDAENEIFTNIAAALRKAFPKITVLSETVFVPPAFPCVCIEETDNYAYRKSADSETGENHAVIVYEVNIYSNKASGKKSECKKFFALIDDFFLKLGFVRNTKIPIPTGDITMYRLFGRYMAVIDKQHAIYRR